MWVGTGCPKTAGLRREGGFERVESRAGKDVTSRVDVGRRWLSDDGQPVARLSYFGGLRNRATSPAFVIRLSSSTFEGVELYLVSDRVTPSYD